MYSVYLIFKRPFQALQWLFVKKIANTMNIFHIKLKSARAYIQQFKLKLLNLIVYILQIKKKVLGAYSGLIDIFGNFYHEKVRCTFISNYAGFLIKIMSTSQTAYNGSNHFKVQYVIVLSFVTKVLTNNYRMPLH